MHLFKHSVIHIYIYFSCFYLSPFRTFTQIDSPAYYAYNVDSTLCATLTHRCVPAGLFPLGTSHRNIVVLTSCARWVPNGHIVQNDVVSTSMRRDDVASPLIRRHFTSCPAKFLPLALARDSKIIQRTNCEANIMIVFLASCEANEADFVHLYIPSEF